MALANYKKHFTNIERSQALETSKTWGTAIIGAMHFYHVRHADIAENAVDLLAKSARCNAETII